MVGDVGTTTRVRGLVGALLVAEGCSVGELTAPDIIRHHSAQSRSLAVTLSNYPWLPT